MSEIEVESPADPRMLEDYRPVSFMSILAVILAFFSCLAIINPMFVLLPILAAMFALVAVLRVEFDSRNPVLGWFSYVALFIACFAATSSMGYRYFNQTYLLSLARQHAEEWWNIVQHGELHRHFELTKDYSERQTDEVDLVQYYRDLQKGRLTFDFYKTLEPEVSVRHAGKDCSIEFVGYGAPPKHQVKADLFFLYYRIIWNDPAKEPWFVNVTVKRQLCLPPLGPQWSIPTMVVVDNPRSNNPIYERKLPYTTEAD